MLIIIIILYFCRELFINYSNYNHEKGYYPYAGSKLLDDAYGC